jgi:broad specificity phosphatase PhoE
MGVIYLVRHGQASFGAEDYDALSELGFAQAEALGASLVARGVPVDVAVRGTMRRHRETAGACLRAMQRALEVREDAGFDEFDHREVLVRFEPRYEDRAALIADMAASEHPMRAFEALFVRAVARWTSGAHDGDYREPYARFAERVDRALLRLADGLGSKESAIVFTSGGPIAAIAATLVGAPADRVYALQQRLVNAGLTKLVVGRSGIALSTLNEHVVFEGERRSLLTYR